MAVFFADITLLKGFGESYALGLKITIPLTPEILPYPRFRLLGLISEGDSREREADYRYREWKPPVDLAEKFVVSAHGKIMIRGEQSHKISKIRR